MGRSAQVTVNPIMWIKALELLMDKLKIAGAEIGQIRCVGGCAQQHGSVFWRKGSEKLLQQLDPTKFLHSQLQNTFSLRDSPVWMDSSTATECDWLETEIGGPDYLAEITGSLMIRFNN
jgi:xylulokinase